MFSGGIERGALGANGLIEIFFSVMTKAALCVYAFSVVFPKNQ